MSKGKGIVISRPSPTSSVPGKIIVSYVDTPEDPNAAVGDTFEMVNGAGFFTLELGDIVECFLNPDHFCEVLRFVEKSIPARGRITVRPDEEKHLDGRVMIIQEPIPNPTNVRSNADEIRFVYNPLYQLWSNDIVDCIPTGQAFCVITNVVQHAEQGA